MPPHSQAPTHRSLLRILTATAPPVQAATSSMGEVRAASLPDLRGHLPPLDGLRGIAVIAVMAFHFSEFSGIRGATPALTAWHGIMSVGWIGVDLFFALSGFLITGILYDSKTGEGYFRTFYTRRALRIFPLYYGVLVLFFLLLPALFPASQAIRANTSSQVWYWTHMANVQIALDGWSSSSFYLVHFWSLAVEEQFYLVWPVVVLMLSGRNLVRLCAGVIAFSLLLRVYLFATGNFVDAYVLTPARMDTLAFGAILAIALRDTTLHVHARRLAAPLAAISALMLCLIAVSRGGLDKTEPVTGTVGFTLLGACFTAAIFFAVTAARNSRRSGVLCSRGLRFFGKYSYALYVFHQPVALVLTAVGLPVVLGRLGADGLPGQIAYSSIATAIATGMALVSWNIYEKQFLRLKDRMAKRALPVPASVRGYVATGNMAG